MKVMNYFNDENFIPVYGLGAKLPPYHNVTSHCFALN